MNRLSTEKRAQIAGMLVEGMSMRAISRTTGIARNTIDKLLIELGTACSKFQDEALRNLDIKRVEADEIWSFTYAKAKNVPDESLFRDGIDYAVMIKDYGNPPADEARRYSPARTTRPAAPSTSSTGW